MLIAENLGETLAYAVQRYIHGIIEYGITTILYPNAGGYYIQAITWEDGILEKAKSLAHAYIDGYCNGLGR